MQLTEQQSTAMEMIRRFVSDKDEQIFILKGYAGTGKTFLVRCIVDYLLSLKILPEIMAPTGRAAKVLNVVLPDGVSASTIHRRIYEFGGGGGAGDNGEFSKLIFPVKESTSSGVYIVDEASMVSSRSSENELFEFGTGVLIDDLLTYARPHHGGKLIFVGDPAQLPPVGDNRSVALDAGFFKEKGLRVTSCNLTDIVRQGKSSCILKNATMLRDLLNENERNTLVFQKAEGEVTILEPTDVAKRYVEAQGGSSAIICFSNGQTSQYNKAIRSLLFPGRTHVGVGDKLMVVRNNYREDRIVLNGEIITVMAVHDETVVLSAPVSTERGGVKMQETVPLEYRKIRCKTIDGEEFYTYIVESLLESNRPSLTPDEFKSMYVSLKIRYWKSVKDYFVTFREFMSRDLFYNALQVKYGYAFTCHKAQGSEWDSVIVDFDKRTGLDADSIRWKYTAVTRAKKSLFCVNLPDIRPLDRLQIRPTAKVKSLSPSKIAFDEARESPFHNRKDAVAVSKYWSVVDNMLEDGAQYSIDNVLSRPYLEIYYVKTPYGETVRVDAYYNKSGLFTKYDVYGDDAVLKRYFEDEANIRYRIEYSPEFESLAILKSKMVSLCEETGTNLISVEQKDWQTAFFMKTSGCCSVLRFYYNKKGEITSVEPLSEKGDEDIKLRQITEKIR